MPELGMIAYVFLSLFLGGLLKGVVGLGLPLVALPLLALALPLKLAVATMVIPVFVTNGAQIFQGKQFRPVLRRFGPTALVLILTIAVAVQALVVMPEDVLFMVVGIALIAMTIAMRFQPKLRIAPTQETWLGPLAGMLGGVMGGISAIYGPPLMLFLASLRLPKHEFVPAISLLFLAGNTGLFIGLMSFGIAGGGDFLLSAAATIPCYLGLWLGQRVHARLDERRFDAARDFVYLASGASFLLRALG